MKSKLLPALMFALVAPVTHAAVIAIGDPLSGLDADETFTVEIRAPFAITSGPAPPNVPVLPSPPWTVVTAANAPTLNFGGFGGPGFAGSFGNGCGPGPETPPCNFQFLNQLPWNTDVFFYRYFTEGGGSANSDLFVIQGLSGTNPDYVSFISSDTLTGNILTDFTGPVISGATPVNLGSVSEGPAWILAFDTGVDQYYIKSVPEPATLALLGLGLAGLGFSRRKQ